MRDFFYCLFFPHPTNNHRARVLHHKFLLSIIAVLVFSSFFFSSSFNPFADKIKAFAEVSLQQLLGLTNERRQENGLPPLAANEELTRAAERKADDMISKDYWAHNAPDGTTPWVFIKEAGYDYIYAGENLARGFSSSTDVVNAWMASKAGHRENILSPNFKDVGFAVKGGKLNGEDTFLVVQEFGSRSLLPVAQKPTNKTFETKKVLGFNSPFFFHLPNLSLSSEIVIFLMFGLITILFIDLIIIQRKKIVRFTGHNMDHMFFLLAIIFVVILFNMGVIL